MGVDQAGREEVKLVDTVPNLGRRQGMFREHRVIKVRTPWRE